MRRERHLGLLAVETKSKEGLLLLSSSHRLRIIRDHKHDPGSTDYYDERLRLYQNGLKAYRLAGKEGRLCRSLALISVEADVRRVGFSRASARGPRSGPLSIVPDNQINRAA